MPVADPCAWRELAMLSSVGTFINNVGPTHLVTAFLLHVQHGAQCMTPCRPCGQNAIRPHA
eukprot:1819807-Amphidinium_carterae.1